MRILFLQSAHPYYTSELSNSLIGLGHDVCVAISEYNCAFIGNGSGDRNREFRELLNPNVSLELLRLPAKTALRTLADNMRAIANIHGIIRRFKPDVIHVHDEPDYRIVMALALCVPRPTIINTTHNAELHLGKKGIKTEFMRPWLRGMAAAAIVHGSQIRKRLLEVSNIPEDSVFQIPHGAYTLYRRWLKGIPSDGKKVLFFGGVFRYKGLQYLIEAAPKVCKQIPDAKFVIAGAGPDWESCKSIIKNPESFILHEGRVLDPDVTRLFEESAIVVLPYVEASQSGVLAVAYAMGRPVIVTRVGSLPEVVDEGETGLIVPPCDSDALAEAIVRILADYELRQKMSASAYKKAMEGDLNWDNIAKKTIKVYETAIGRRKRH